MSATPELLTAATESPPPTMVIASRLRATAPAISLVPRAKAGISKTPMGPFQMTVLALAISVAKSAMDSRSPALTGERWPARSACRKAITRRSIVIGAAT